MVERDLVVTTSFLSDAMGFSHLGTENGWHRYGVGDGKVRRYVDLREMPTANRGAWGTGSIHHIAWRVDDEAHQLEVRERVAEEGAHPTPVIDRFWFKSVYFKEPGGVLFELATEGPGFAVDEDPRASRRIARAAAVAGTESRRNRSGASQTARADALS